MKAILNDPHVVVPFVLILTAFFILLIGALIGRPDGYNYPCHDICPHCPCMNNNIPCCFCDTKINI